MKVQAAVSLYSKHMQEAKQMYAQNFFVCKKLKSKKKNVAYILQAYIYLIENITIPYRTVYT